MVFNFNLIPHNQIYQRLCYISEQENFINYNDTCDYISRISNGCMREAISLLEKCTAYNKELDINKLINNDNNVKEFLEKHCRKVCTVQVPVYCPLPF